MCVSSSINKHLHANTLTTEIESKTKLINLVCLQHFKFNLIAINILRLDFESTFIDSVIVLFTTLY